VASIFASCPAFWLRSRVSWLRRSGGVAERRSLGGGCDVEAAFAEAVALAFEGDHGGVVDEPVDQGGGDHRVAEDHPLGVAGDERHDAKQGRRSSRRVGV
jgi:hypothetical protein